MTTFHLLQTVLTKGTTCFVIKRILDSLDPLLLIEIDGVEHTLRCPQSLVLALLKWTSQQNLDPLKDLEGLKVEASRIDNRLDYRFTKGR